MLKRGKSLGDFAKSELSLPELTDMMAGGAELEELAHELERSPDEAGLGREMLADQ